MLKHIDSTHHVTLKETIQIITHNPHAVFLLRGARGTGKTSIGNLIAKITGKPLAGGKIIQAPQEEVGNFKFPVMKDGSFVFVPNESFGLHTGEPVTMVIDEFDKCHASVQNLLHEPIEPKGSFMGIPLHPDSIRIICGNLEEEGLGRIRDHTHDRVIELVMKGATQEEMIEYAIESGWHETVIAFMHEFPECLLTILDGDAWKNSPYKGVTRRGLEGVSDIMHSSYGKLSSKLLSCEIAGRVGSPFAKQFQAFVDFKDQLPSHDEILKDPMKAKLPATQGAACVFIFGSLTRIDKTTISQYMKYISRFEPEWEMMFVLGLAKNKQSIAFSSPDMRDKLLEMSDLI
jgi:hypothetical protein